MISYRYGYWVSPREICKFRYWIIHLWNDFESWSPIKGLPENIRIFGFSLRRIANERTD